MKEIRMSDIDLLEVGNTISIAGSIWSDPKGNAFIITFPDCDKIDPKKTTILRLSVDEWKIFLRQSDLLETEILVRDDNKFKKAIVRKSARIIDAQLQWRVFQRDGYKCRYCGRTGLPLTVDHVDLWEDGGATTEENLLSACKKCNKKRGNISYPDWIKSPDYARMSRQLSAEVQKDNLSIVSQMADLEKLRVQNVRSR
jgi:hypothetical protein